MPAFPAARIGDPVTHDLFALCGFIAHPLTGPCRQGEVLIEKLPAAHLNCAVLCSGTTIAGPVINPLHAIPVPVVASESPPTLNPDDCSCARSSSAACNSEPDSAPADPENALSEFSLQVLGGWTWGASLPLPGRMPSPGMRHDKLILRIEDAQGNVAIYEYEGTGDTEGWGDAYSSAEFDVGDRIVFCAPPTFSADTFTGQARLNSTQIAGKTDYAFKFGKPRERELELNEDFHRDALTRFGTVPFAKWKEYEVKIDPFELREKPTDPPNRTLFSIDDTVGVMTLTKFFPKPSEPPTASVAFLPTPSTNPIIKGSTSVLIHGLPAARWVVSGDVAMCGALLGDPKLVPTRTVWIGS